MLIECRSLKEDERDTTINKHHRIKIFSRICYVLALVSLIVGASFHGYRIHPENVEHYNIGVTMGITMIIVFIIFLVAGILLTLIEKKDADEKRMFELKQQKKREKHKGH